MRKAVLIRTKIKIIFLQLEKKAVLTREEIGLKKNAVLNGY